MNQLLKFVVIYFSLLFSTCYNSQASPNLQENFQAGNESLENSLEQDAESNEIPEFLYKQKAKIIILNKITAKSELVEFKLGEPQYFGNLSVEIQKCVKKQDPLRPSNLMLLSVFDNKPDDDRVAVFQGWMDSSNLSISTVEHPIYEIIPKECVD